MPRTFKLHEKDYTEVSTRIPVKMQMYTKALAFALNTTVGKLQEEAIARFLKEQPCRHGLKWRQTQALSASLQDGLVGVKQGTGWMQVNFRMPLALHAELETMVADANRPQPADRDAGVQALPGTAVSMSGALYTIMYWYTWYVYPPVQEVERRRQLEAAKKERAG